MHTAHNPRYYHHSCLAKNVLGHTHQLWIFKQKSEDEFQHLTRIPTLDQILLKRHLSNIKYIHFCQAMWTIKVWNFGYRRFIVKFRQKLLLASCKWLMIETPSGNQPLDPSHCQLSHIPRLEFQIVNLINAIIFYIKFHLKSALTSNWFCL